MSFGEKVHDLYLWQNIRGKKSMLRIGFAAYSLFAMLIPATFLFHVFHEGQKFNSCPKLLSSK